MLPNLLILGFIAGLISVRFGWLVVPLSALAWALGLAEAGICDGSCAPDAAAIAAANATVGVALGNALRWSAVRVAHPR